MRSYTGGTSKVRGLCKTGAIYTKIKNFLIQSWTKGGEQPIEPTFIQVMNMHKNLAYIHTNPQNPTYHTNQSLIHTNQAFIDTNSSYDHTNPAFIVLLAAIFIVFFGYKWWLIIIHFRLSIMKDTPQMYDDTP